MSAHFPQVVSEIAYQPMTNEGEDKKHLNKYFKARVTYRS